MGSTTEPKQLETPVVLLIFNRPDSTRQMFEVVRKIKPAKLFLIADGPRKERPGEKEKCEASREIVKQIDWECNVKMNFSESNMGCRNCISSGLTWVFNHVEEAIILEDDCVPDKTFFRFCEELLSRYRNDQRIMAISGDNFQFGRKRTDYSYYFSRFNHCWGWATWRRAWKFYEDDMRLWPEIKDHGWLGDLFEKKQDREVWSNIFQDVFDEKVNSWAVRWTFACWMQNGLTILPNVNLVSNIGFDGSATHTKDKKNKLAFMQVESLDFPLKHPSFVIRDHQADLFTQKFVFNPSRLTRLRIAIAGMLHNGLGL